MQYYFDTEFLERGYQYPIDLISIGIVADDGRELYGQLVDAPHRNATEWLLKNVYSAMETCLHDDAIIDAAVHHGMFLESGEGCLANPFNCPWKTREMLRADVLALVGADPKPVFLGWYSSYDWVLLSQLISTTMITLPSSFPHLAIDIRQYQKHLGNNERLPKQIGTKHNALEDARWTAEAYRYLKGLDKKNGR